MQSGESKVIDTSFVAKADQFVPLTLAIPGADHRINDDPNRIYSADVVLDIEKVVFDSNIKIFPNPSSDFINLESENKIVELSIYNAQGQLMIFKAGQVDLRRINVQDLNSGTYFI